MVMLSGIAAVAALVALVAILSRHAGVAPRYEVERHVGHHSHSVIAREVIMTKLGPPMEGDRERARKIIAEVRERIMPFADYHNALEQGFTIYLPKLPQSEYHFFGMVPPAVHFQAGRHPLALTALMYAPAESSGYRLAGAMIRANADTPLPKLDQIAPMSIGRWHRHINVCLPRGFTLMDFVRGNLGQDRSGLPGMLPADDDPAAAARNATLGVLADGRFGGGGALDDPVK
ncbi:MAG: hypothetical protein ACREB3_13730, partial [Burkholderiales bacterium]